MGQSTGAGRTSNLRVRLSRPLARRQYRRPGLILPVGPGAKLVTIGITNIEPPGRHLEHSLVRHSFGTVGLHPQVKGDVGVVLIDCARVRNDDSNVGSRGEYRPHAAAKAMPESSWQSASLI